MWHALNLSLTENSRKLSDSKTLTLDDNDEILNLGFASLKIMYS